ncbi:MAG: hypothetical protein ACHQYQ_02165 [Bacteriovoracales bacterium]
MKNKKVILLFLAIIFIAVGIYLGMPKQESLESVVARESKISQMDNIKQKDISTRVPSSIKTPETKAAPTETPKTYKENLFNDPVVKSLKIRTKEIFKNYPFAEEISDWMAIGAVMDGSQNYGIIYLGTLRKLNERPREVLTSLEKEIKNLDEKDSFIRNMFLNLANNLKVSGQEKISFFGPEIVRTIKLDEKGNLTEDSMNITNSMEFFKKYAKSDKDVLQFAKRAMDLNGSDPKTKQELMIRIKSYFPQIVDELNRN